MLLQQLTVRPIDAQKELYWSTEISALLTACSDNFRISKGGHVPDEIITEIVHKKYKIRGAKPDQDKVKVTLKKGPNNILIKVTQDIGGWKLYCRILKSS